MVIRRILQLILYLLPFVTMAQNTVLQSFADITYNFSNEKGSRDGFAVGQYDHFLKSDISDEMTVLTEVVFEYDGGWRLDVERIWVRYYIEDYFQVSAGKFHTGLGYWNRAYHHGAVLHTSIDRPFMLFFEDEGGLLPIHLTGLLFSGSGMGDLNFGYDIMVGNGIGSTPTEENDHTKSLSAYFHIKPMDGLDAGVSFYKDRIARKVLDDAVPAPLNPIDQQMFGASLNYNHHNIEFLTEYLNVNNKDNKTGTSGVTNAFYVLTSYAFPKVRPYFKYDYVKFDSNEPFYRGRDDVKIITLGLRHDFNFLSAIKAEVRFNTFGSQKTMEAVTQIAFGF